VSGQHQGKDVDLNSIIGEADGDGGIPHGAILAAYAEAVLGDDGDRLDAARERVRDAMGDAALVDAAAVAATFNAIDRVADATGIPIDEERLEPTAGFRKDLGIDAFPSRTSA
jgi:alcohol dehydrogenase class IV